MVSVHPLMQHIPARVLAARAKRLGRAAPVPLATVVTDFTTCHNTWFYRKVDKCFVPTEFCRWAAAGPWCCTFGAASCSQLQQAGLFRVSSWSSQVGAGTGSGEASPVD